MELESEEEIVNFGKSIIVPSVQELAKESLAEIPPRYTHSFRESPLIPDRSSFLSVPVVDLQCLATADTVDSELHRLHSACREWGFFQVWTVTVISMI